MLYLLVGIGFEEEVLKKSQSSQLLKRIENIILRLLNFSLDIVFIPIKKVVFLLKLYLEIIFEDISKKNQEKMLTKSTSEKIFWESPRSLQKNRNSIELFYV